MILIGISLILLGLGQGYYFAFNSIDYLAGTEMWVALTTIGYLAIGGFTLYLEYLKEDNNE